MIRSRVSASYHEVKLFAGELRRLVDDNLVAKIRNYLVGKLEAQVFVGEFAPAVDNGQLHFVSSFQEIGNFAELDLQVVLTDLQPEAHLLYLKCFRIFLVALHLLRTLVAVFPPVNDFDDWWLGIR